MQDVQGAHPLLPLLRSPVQGELLAWLYLHPDEEYSISDLARRFQVSQATVSREADRLAGGGLVNERRVGNLRLVSANTDTPVARPLADLLVVTYGPVPVLNEVLAGIAGIVEAYIYGSWADRYQGTPGQVPRDIDVLVVGDADEDDVYEAARVAEGRLGREVNIRRVTPDAWQRSEDDPFLRSVRTGAMVRLDVMSEHAGEGRDAVAAGPGRHRRDDRAG